MIFKSVMLYAVHTVQYCSINKINVPQLLKQNKFTTKMIVEV